MDESNSSVPRFVDHAIMARRQAITPGYLEALKDRMS